MCFFPLTKSDYNHSSPFRVGSMILSTDLTSEWQFRDALAQSAIQIYHNRIAFENPITEKSLSSLQQNIINCLENILPDVSLDAVTLGCTSASAFISHDVMTRMIQTVKPQATLITPLQSSIDAMKLAHIDRITLLAPYDETITQVLAEQFFKQGITILNQRSLGLQSDQDIAHLTYDTIETEAQNIIHPDAQAIFISCTALATLFSIPLLEKKLKQTVLTSNQCILFQLIQCYLQKKGNDAITLKEKELLTTRHGTLFTHIT